MGFLVWTNESHHISLGGVNLFFEMNESIVFLVGENRFDLDEKNQLPILVVVAVEFRPCYSDSYKSSLADVDTYFWLVFHLFFNWVIAGDLDWYFASVNGH
jgi:hypothetical protein